MIAALTADPRRAPLIVALASAATLGAALVSQYGFGLQPCVLCIWQRWPYVATIVLGLLALAFWQRPAARRWLLGLAAVAFAADAGIAVFHVGVEQHWWQGTAACAGGPPADSVEALRAQLLGRQPVRCDEVAFVFLGLSMAAWNALIAATLALFSFAAARRGPQ